MIEPTTAPRRASAPGSLMLMGEHAVLHGHRALVCAVDQRLTVTATPRHDRCITITSALGQAAADLDALPHTPPFQFVWAAIEAAQPPHGVDLEITADFSHKLGLGSSAAVTVATLAALHADPTPLDHNALHERATRVIQTVQGRGSGADAAASVYGGIVAYRAAPRKINPLMAIHDLAVIYAGYKTPTAEVIARVEQAAAERPALYAGFYHEIDDCVRAAIDAICRDDWNETGHWFDANHALMNALGVNDPNLEKIVQGLRAQPGILGAKISGSGLGDCAIGLGQLTDWSLPYEVLPCRMTLEGVRLEPDLH